jgi:hypothetical protein
VYRKWNEKLFAEMYHSQAFRCGEGPIRELVPRRAGESTYSPSTCFGHLFFWPPSHKHHSYAQGFFDFYITPLAKKLSECGVFGISSYEYLSYAQNNRAEWVIKGQSIVADMVAKYKAEEP